MLARHPAQDIIAAAAVVSGVVSDRARSRSETFQRKSREIIRTQSAIASAMPHRSTAGGLISTRPPLFGSITASSRTRSVLPQSSGPLMLSIGGAIARSAVSRTRHADGVCEGASVLAGSTSLLGKGRGRGNGTVCAAAILLGRSVQ